MTGGGMTELDQAWLTTVSDTDEAIALTTRLVAIRSYPGEEHAVQEEIAAWFRKHGIEPELQEIGDGRHNVIARVENGSGPTLLFNGHVDTVLAAQGWSSDPWQARREGNRLYGLGACDMKSGVAAAMLATRALHERRDCWSGAVIFTAVPDEEAYSAGAQALVKSGIQADACIVTEANWTPVIGAVGKVLVRVDVTGKAAHGSWPADGVNAAIEAAKLVARLDELPLGQHPRVMATQTVLSMHSGSEQYVLTLPETARVLINRHPVPGEPADGVIQQLRALIDDLDSPAHFELTIDPPFYPPWETDPALPFVQLFARAYEAELDEAPALLHNQGIADTNYFGADLGIPSVQFGPRGANFHQADEWVDVESIGVVIRILLRTAVGFQAG